ncbi:MAG: SIS domain-containing protein [Planctomycetales bacterium]|nr:SIS domain-containing protein [Planctomycetales bacterium]
MKKTEKYTQFALCREMMETPGIIRNFKLKDTPKTVAAIKSAGKLFLTGEGSSRIFPAKNVIYTARKAGMDLNMATDGGRQAAEYNLSDFVVFGASNSGSTKEVIALLDHLRKAGHKNCFGLTAREGTKLSTLAHQTFVLNCGWETAVAATKSVAEQALVYQELLAQLQGTSLAGKLGQLADAVEQALTMDIDPAMIKAIANAGTIYFAGRNDGVAEELTLKTNEITRKKSDFLEGTYAVHGIEEVMNSNDVVILINPFKAELEKIKETLVDGVGLKVFSVCDEDTMFGTLKVKDAGTLRNYVYLAAGWNILVEVGVALGINLDKAERARKVGNEFVN